MTFNLKSTFIYLLSLLSAEAALLASTNVTTLQELWTLPIIVKMIVVAGGVTVPWGSYSPMDKPMGSPEKPNATSIIVQREAS